MGMRFGVKESTSGRLHSHLCRGGSVGPKTENFTKIMAYKCPAGAYPWAIFTQFLPSVDSFMIHHVLNFKRIRWRGVRSYGFTFRGVHITPNFRCPLAAKLRRMRICFKSAKMLRISSITNHHNKYDGARTSHAAKEWKFSTFLSVCLSFMLLNNKIC